MQWETLDDDTLALAAQRGDKDAFETLVLRYRASAVRFAASITGGWQDAEDVAQESFAKIYLRFGSYRGGTSFKSWMFTILRNTALDALRRRRSHAPLDEANGVMDPDTPQDALARSEEWLQVAADFATLEPEARCALYLFAVEGLPYKDIAAALGKTQAGVKTMIYRARKRLRKEAEAR